MSEPKFSIPELLKFQMLQTNLKRVQKEISEIDNEILLLQQKKLEANKRIEAINADINGKYKELSKVMAQNKLTSLSPFESEEIEIESPNYVSKMEKELLLSKLISEYRRLYFPEKGAVPFSWIKSQLKKQYDIETKSISNFFVGILDNYELVGGNRNRSISLKGIE